MQSHRSWRKGLSTKKSAQMHRLIEGYTSSDMTIREYCVANKINPKTFYYWRRKHKVQAPVLSPKPGLLPLKIASFNQEDSPIEHPSLFAEVGGIRLYQVVPAEYLLTLLNR